MDSRVNSGKIINSYPEPGTLPAQRSRGRAAESFCMLSSFHAPSSTDKQVMNEWLSPQLMTPRTRYIQRWLRGILTPGKRQRGNEKGAWFISRFALCSHWTAPSPAVNTSLLCGTPKATSSSLFMHYYFFVK